MSVKALTQTIYGGTCATCGKPIAAESKGNFVWDSSERKLFHAECKHPAIDTPSQPKPQPKPQGDTKQQPKPMTKDEFVAKLFTAREVVAEAFHVPIDSITYENELVGKVLDYMRSVGWYDKNNR